MPHIKDIQIRDPFVILLDGIYYLFGSTDKDIWHGPGTGFDVYTGKDLYTFDGPFPAFRPPAGFWASTNFWAPEVHHYQGAWYMFATFMPDRGRRGTAILKSERIEGPYLPWSEGPVTPPEWECLDGTFYLDGEGQPWMVFCHEWVQVGDGEICLLPLSADLKTAAGKPELLFRASEAPWAKPLKGRDPGRYPVPGPYYVTDGPNVFTAKNGRFLLLWSSFGEAGNYLLGTAVSESGSIRGPWKQSEKALYEADGGHGMIFSTPEGKLYLAVHRPNKPPHERPIFVEVQEQGGNLSLASMPKERL